MCSVLQEYLFEMVADRPFGEKVETIVDPLCSADVFYNFPLIATRSSAGTIARVSASFGCIYNLLVVVVNIRIK